MILVGQYDSPFTRRVAVSLHLLGIPFARNTDSVFANAASTIQVNRNPESRSRRSLVAVVASIAATVGLMLGMIFSSTDSREPGLTGGRSSSDSNRQATELVSLWRSGMESIEPDAIQGED